MKSWKIERISKQGSILYSREVSDKALVKIPKKISRLKLLLAKVMAEGLKNE